MPIPEVTLPIGLGNDFDNWTEVPTKEGSPIFAPSKQDYETTGTLAPIKTSIALKLVTDFLHTISLHHSHIIKNAGQTGFGFWTSSNIVGLDLVEYRSYSATVCCRLATPWACRSFPDLFAVQKKIQTIGNYLNQYFIQPNHFTWPWRRFEIDWRSFHRLISFNISLKFFFFMYQQAHGEPSTSSRKFIFFGFGLVGWVKLRVYKVLSFYFFFNRGCYWTNGWWCQAGKSASQGGWWSQRESPAENYQT